MRYIFLLTVILISSCENRKKTIVNRQQVIKNEMEQVKASYNKKTDSLRTVMEMDTDSAKHDEIAKEVVTVDDERIAILLALQKEYDSLETVLRK